MPNNLHPESIELATSLCKAAVGEGVSPLLWWKRMVVERARRVQQFLSQPLNVAETFTGLPGRYVKLEDTLRSFEAILGGETDRFPEVAFSLVGTVDEAAEKAKALGAV